MDDSFNGSYWYYLNRGYPQAFTGWTLQGTVVAFPHVKLPFIASGDQKLEKILDMAKTAPLILFVFLIVYAPSFVLAKAVDENKRLTPFYASLCLIFITATLFIYFSIFTRV